MTDNDKKEKAIESIQQNLAEIKSNALFKIYGSVYRLLTFQFLKGIAFGLGSIVGATIVMSVVLFFLSKIEFLPIIGDWIHQVGQELEQYKK